MWLIAAFISAIMLGCYDMAKKQSLRNNAVIPVLFLNCLFCSLIFSPFVVESAAGLIPSSSEWYTPWTGWASQKWIIIKSLIVLSSWILGYYGIRDIPLTIVGPINSTRPVMTLLGAIVVFGERLSLLQWIGVLTAFVSLFLLSLTGKKEGIDFRRNKAVWLVIVAAILGACSSLYDKFLMASPDAGGIGLSRMEVLSWYNIYQCLWMMVIMLAIWLPKKEKDLPFRWSYTIMLISIFLSIADFAYFFALSKDGAMVSIVSMVRRSNVIVSFFGGVLLLHETQNWKQKAFDLTLIFVGMVLIWLGTE